MPDEILSIQIRLAGAREAQVEAVKTAKAVDRVGSSSEKAGRKARESAKGFDVAAASQKGFGRAAGLFAGLGLVASLGEVLKAGMSYQAQQASLRQALQATGQSTSNLARINKALEESALHGGFAVNQQTQGVAQFIRVTGSASKALEMNKAATDLARGGHIEYTRAVRMMALASGGNLGRLHAYVGTIQPVTANMDALRASTKHATSEQQQQAQALDKQATATLIMQRIQQRYGGATDRFSKTAQGAISNLRNTVEIFAQRAAAKILPLITHLAKLAAAFLGPSKQAKILREAVLYLGVAIATLWVRGKLLALGGWLADLVMAEKSATAATDMFSAALDRVPLLLIATGIAILVTQWHHLSGLMKGMIVEIIAAAAAWWVMDAAMDANPILAVVLAIATVITVVAEMILHFKQVKAWVEKNWKTVAAVLAFPFLAIPILLIHVFVNPIKRILGDVWRWIKTAAANVYHFIIDPISHAISWMGSLPGKFLHWFSVAGKAIWQGIGWALDRIKSALKWILDHIPLIGKKSGGAGGGLKGALLGAAAGPVGLIAGGLAGAAGILPFAHGGLIPGVLGGSPTADSHVVAAQPGEFMLNRRVVSQLGVPQLNAMNRASQFPLGAGGNSQLGTPGGLAGGPQPLVVRIPVYIGSRQVTEAVTHFQLKRSARGGANPYLGPTQGAVGA